MPLKRTYASLDISEPETDLNQHQFLPLTRHHQYYLPGGDLYIQVEKILFRVHSYFFTRELSGDSLHSQPLTSTHSTLPYILDNSDPFSVTLRHTP